MPSLRPSKARQKMLTDDFKDLLRPLNANVVKYLIIGGHAFGVHAEPRRTSTTPSAPTKRMPTRFFVQQPSLAPGSPAEVRQTSPTEPLFKLVFPPDRIDILQRIDGVEFDEAYLNRFRATSMGKSKRLSYPERISFETNWRAEESRIFSMSRLFALRTRQPRTARRVHKERFGRIQR